MRAPMDFQLVLTSKCLRAKLALKWTLASMDSFMDLQFVAMHKLLLAIAAVKKFLPRVQPLMQL